MAGDIDPGRLQQVDRLAKDGDLSTALPCPCAGSIQGSRNLDKTGVTALEADEPISVDEAACADHPALIHHGGEDVA